MGGKKTGRVRNVFFLRQKKRKTEGKDRKRVVQKDFEETRKKTKGS